MTQLPTFGRRTFCLVVIFLFLAGNFRGVNRSIVQETAKLQGLTNTDKITTLSYSNVHTQKDWGNPTQH